MAKSKDTLLRWLRDAHAMERATAESLERLQGRFKRYPEFATRMQQYGEESHHHAERLEAALRRLGTEPSAFKNLTTRLLGLVEAYATAVVPDEEVKDCLALYAVASFGVISYVSLAAAARTLAEVEIERMCEEHMQHKRAMALWLEQRVPDVTEEYLRP